MEFRIYRKGALNLAAVVLIGGAAYYLSSFHRILDPLVLGIILGMIARQFFFKSNDSEKIFIDLSYILIAVGIVAYGVNLNFAQMLKVDLYVWGQVVIGILLIFWIGIVAGEAMGLDARQITLICVGTAICGASAIALISPLVKAKSKDTSIALLVITLIGLIVLSAYFFTGLGTRMPEESFAFFSATTLHQTGLVRLAASSVSPECLSAALAVKPVRTAMIIPLIFCVSFFINTREHVDLSARILVKKSFLKIPAFLWGFILVGILFAYFPHSSFFEQSMKDFSAFLWTLAMTSLGMTVDAKQVISSFVRPFALGWIVWAVVVGNFCIAFFGLGI